MNYGSVCSGIEAATVGWHELNWSPAFFSEIEAFPSAVLKHRYPKVENRGDMTKFKGWPNDRIDILVGGTPCQSFSIAGFRKGLADPRGNLALVFLAIADRLRPKWLVWENVPGVLSSNEGRDFGCFLGGLGELGYGFAYRILDAQYFGVPQRRRRPFVVGYLGDWRRAAAVLFERHSLQGNPTPSRETEQEVAGTFTARARSGGWDQDPNLAASGYMRPVYSAEIAPTLDSHYGDKQGLENQHINSGGGCSSVSRCLNAGGMGRQDYETETLIPIGGGFDVAHTLRGEGFDGGEDGTGRGVPLVASPLTACYGKQPDNSIGGIPNILAFSSKDHGADAGELSPTLRSMGHDKSHPNAGGQIAVKQGMRVRRLTPLECERLQGFPDGYTQVPYRGKPAADGPRYKALGNSMATTVMKWIGQRIALVESHFA